MSRIKSFFIILLGVLLILPNQVNASYNGGSGGSLPPSGSECPTAAWAYGKLCTWNNANHGTVRVSIYHFNKDGSKDRIGKSIVYTNNDWRNLGFYKFNDGFCSVSTMNGAIGYSSTCLKNYFSNTEYFEEFARRAIGYGSSVSFNDYIKKMSDIYGDEWNQPSPGEYGFRIVIEPFLSFWMKNADGSSNYWYYTPKEAALKGTTFDSKNVGPFSTYLSLNWTDVQIQARAGAATSMSDLANPKLGYGYNIIDIDNLGKSCTPGDKDCPNQCKEDDPSCNVCKEDDPDCGGSGCLPTDPDCGEPDCDIKDPKCNNPKTCDYKIDMSIPNNCETSNLGYIYDINYWKCIFASSNSKKTDIKNHYDNNFSNKYCAIYCYEKIDYSLPLGNNEVYAGRYLTISSASEHGELTVISPIKFSSKKVCRTTNSKGQTGGYINKEKFVSDFNQIENKITQQWDTYNQLKSKKRACDKASSNYTTTSESHCTGGYSPSTCYNSAGQAYNCQVCNSYSTYTVKSYSASDNWYGGTETCSWTYCDYGHGASKPNYDSQISSALSSWQSSIDSRDKMIKEINACTTQAVTNDFKPKLDFTYQEPIYGGTWELKEYNRTENTVEKYYSSGNAINNSGTSTTGSYNVINSTKYTCSNDQKCTKSTSFTYPDVTWWDKTLTQEMLFQLPDNVYRYISKDKNQSYETASEAGINYIKVDRSNLPIHYSTLPGKYKFWTTIKTLGDNNKFTKFLKNKKTFNGKIIYGGDAKYQCTYNVSCDFPAIIDNCVNYNKACPSGGGNMPTCPGQGITLEYRTISLYNKQAFPGLSGGNSGPDGEGRSRGNNWKDYEVVKEIIYNGRGATSYDIYRLSPMYEITLDVATMRKIREYNRQMNAIPMTITTIKSQISGTGKIKDSKTKTGIAGFADFESMTCTDGKKCISSKIREWGVKGCAIEKDFTTASYPRCGNTEKW